MNDKPFATMRASKITPRKPRTPRTRDEDNTPRSERLADAIKCAIESEVIMPDSAARGEAYREDSELHLHTTVSADIEKIGGRYQLTISADNPNREYANIIKGLDAATHGTFRKESASAIDEPQTYSANGLADILKAMNSALRVPMEYKLGDKELY